MADSFPRLFMPWAQSRPERRRRRARMASSESSTAVGASAPDYASLADELYADEGGARCQDRGHPFGGPGSNACFVDVAYRRKRRPCAGRPRSAADHPPPARTLDGQWVYKMGDGTAQSPSVVRAPHCLLARHRGAGRRLRVRLVVMDRSSRRHVDRTRSVAKRTLVPRGSGNRLVRVLDCCVDAVARSSSARIRRPTSSAISSESGSPRAGQRSIVWKPRWSSTQVPLISVARLRYGPPGTARGRGSRRRSQLRPSRLP